VEAGIDAQVAHTGGHSIHIHFDGQKNLDYSDVGQTAFVTPGRYRIEAYMRTQEITTDKGIALHLYDGESAARFDVSTEELTGTHDWTKIERAITIPRETRLLRIEVSRQRSMKFDNQIGGTVWIDGVKLAPLNSSVVSVK
jgi:hypothetical protein